jgi:hypothetical protein
LRGRSIPSKSNEIILLNPQTVLVHELKA